MKKLLTLSFLLCVFLQTMAYEWTDGNGVSWTYTVSESKATITKSTQTTGDLVIPSKVYDGTTEYAVTTIGGSAFKSKSKLTSAVIPEGVTSIGNSAFYNCSGLTSVVLPNGLVSIGNKALYGCLGLTDLTIPEGVTSIGQYAFSGCSGLTSMAIPSSMNKIGSFVFENCSSLTSVYIPSSVKSIGEKSFYGCSSLTSVTIPSRVTNIGAEAFENCSSLTSVTINSNVIISKDYVYDYYEYFDGNTHEVITVYPNNLRTIFGNQVNYYIIGEGVTSIGEGVFSHSEGLISVSIPSSVTRIDEYAFCDCSSLTSMTISSSVTHIGKYAFDQCPNLICVTINSDAVVSRGEDEPNGDDDYNMYFNTIFGHQVRLYIIGEGVTRIGSFAFSGCSGLTSVTIPSSVTSIGQYAFSGCSDLTSVTIPEGVTNIGNYAFEYCTGLTSVTLPSGVTRIGKYAFYDCSGLTSVYCHIATPLAIDSETFTNRAKATLYVPYGCKSAYQNAYCWEDFKEIVEMEDTGGSSGISTNIAAPDKGDIRVFGVNGQPQPAMRSGLNIIRMSDGTTRKIIGQGH